MLEEHPRYYEVDLKDSAIGRRLFEESPEEQRAFVLAVVEWLGCRYAELRPGRTEDWSPVRRVESVASALLLRRLPFGHNDVASLLDWSVRHRQRFQIGIPQMIKVVQDYLREHELTPALREKIERLVELTESEYHYNTAEKLKWVVRLKELGGLTEQRMPLVAGEACSDAAIADIEMMDGEARIAWMELLNLCMKADGPKPSARWSRIAGPLLEKIGFPAFKDAVLRSLPRTTSTG